MTCLCVSTNRVTAFNMAVELAMRRAEDAGDIVIVRREDSLDIARLLLESTPHAGESGTCPLPLDDPAPSFEAPHAGEPADRVKVAGDPAPISPGTVAVHKAALNHDLPLSGGANRSPSSAAASFPGAPPMPNPLVPWKASYSPDQLGAIIRLMSKGGPNAETKEIAERFRMTCGTVADIRKWHVGRINWLKGQTGPVRDEYLREFTRFNNERAKLSAKTPPITTPPVVAPPKPAEPGEMDMSNVGPKMPPKRDTPPIKVSFTADDLLRPNKNPFPKPARAVDDGSYRDILSNKTRERLEAMGGKA